MADKITLVATITALTEFCTEVRNALKKVESEVQSEQGCEMYQLHIDLNNANQFVMIERWKSKAMLEQHTQARPFKDFVHAIEGKASLQVVTLTRIE